MAWRCCVRPRSTERLCKSLGAVERESKLDMKNFIRMMVFSAGTACRSLPADILCSFFERRRCLWCGRCVIDGTTGCRSRWWNGCVSLRLEGTGVPMSNGCCWSFTELPQAATHLHVGTLDRARRTSDRSMNIDTPVHHLARAVETRSSRVNVLHATLHSSLTASTIDGLLVHQHKLPLGFDAR